MCSQLEKDEIYEQHWDQMKVYLMSFPPAQLARVSWDATPNHLAEQANAFTIISFERRCKPPS